ncbi:MAG: hypothetical protein Q8M83_06390 [bacterium]|nr:hypothetical protein [bacterium]
MPDKKVLKEGAIMEKNDILSEGQRPEAPRPADIELEKISEKETETGETKLLEEESIGKGGDGMVKTQIPAAPPKDEVLTQVEKILEEDLEDIYFNLPPETRQKFHDKGEETAGKIRLILGQAKIQVKKILNLIRDWLKIIPGVNKFFLEQEAKIKTDKILLLVENEKEKQK